MKVYRFMIAGMIVSLIAIFGLAYLIRFKPTHYWSIRTIWFDDNEIGRAVATRWIQKIERQNIAKVFSRKEAIQGEPCIVIYIGKFESHEVALKKIDKCRKLHRYFRWCDIVEIKHCGDETVIKEAK